MKIITNHQPRPTLFYQELTLKEMEQFDYLDTNEKKDAATFFRYRDNTYEMGDFMKCQQHDSEISSWDGYRGDSFYSGIVVKWVKPDYDQVVVGLYLA